MASNWPEIIHSSLYFSANLGGKYLGEISQIYLIDTIDCYIQMNILVATMYYFKAKMGLALQIFRLCVPVLDVQIPDYICYAELRKRVAED